MMIPKKALIEYLRVPRTRTEISEHFGYSVQTITSYLQYLQEELEVIHKKEGKGVGASKKYWVYNKNKKPNLIGKINYRYEALM